MGLFATGNNSPTFRTVDQGFSTFFTTVISFRNSNFMRKMRYQNLWLARRLSVHACRFSQMENLFKFFNTRNQRLLSTEIFMSAKGTEIFFKKYNYWSKFVNNLWFSKISSILKLGLQEQVFNFFIFFLKLSIFQSSFERMISVASVWKSCV